MNDHREFGSCVQAEIIQATRHADGVSHACHAVMASISILKGQVTAVQVLVQSERLPHRPYRSAFESQCRAKGLACTWQEGLKSGQAEWPSSAWRSWSADRACRKSSTLPQTRGSSQARMYSSGVIASLLDSISSTSLKICSELTGCAPANHWMHVLQYDR